MASDRAKAKILFIDDEESTVENYMRFLRREGYTNVVLLPSVNSLAEVASQKADLVFLDVTGVAGQISPSEDGIAVLKFLKRQAPWTRVILLSGSLFPVSSADDLNLADARIKKGALSMAEFLTLTEEHLEAALSPAARNGRIFQLIADQIDELALGWLKKWRIKKVLRNALANQQNPAFNWSNAAAQLKSLLAGVILVKDLVEALH